MNVDELSDDRLVTPNSESSAGSGQRAIRQDINPPVAKRGGKFWGVADGGIPFDAVDCFVFTDDLAGGMRSGSKLLVAVDGDATKLVVDAGPMIARPASFADPGELLVGDERIGYGGHSKVGNKLFFTGISRAGGETVQANHAAGTFVRWLVDPDDATLVIVAHEAGHNVKLSHDTAEKSVMTQIKGGQTDHHHDFRHVGATAGSTQQFKVK